MHGSVGAAALLSAVSLANAATHELIVGTFGTAFLYTLEFDDEALTLDLVANTSVPVAASWLNFNHDKTALYGNAYGGTGFRSYAFGENASSITQTGSVTDINCTSQAIYQVADQNPPYAVYGSYFGGSSTAGCGTVMAVDETGALTKTIQNFTYETSSGVHGSAISKDSKFLFSADDAENKLWVHSIDPATGEVTEIAGLEAPTVGADPRHVAVHPNGTYVYVLFEGSSQVAQYTVDTTTGVPSFTNVTYPLILDGLDVASYWADEVALSPSGKYLWATNRGPRDSTANGYISAFTLAEDGEILGQNFLLNTTSSGGAANAVTPSPFSDKFVALTDSLTGFVEIWALSDDATSASVVAHLDIVDAVTAGKGCCANAVWYS